VIGQPGIFRHRRAAQSEKQKGRAASATNLFDVHPKQKSNLPEDC
jgi:hypothetical protein